MTGSPFPLVAPGTRGMRLWHCDLCRKHGTAPNVHDAAGHLRKHRARKCPAARQPS